MQNPSIVFQRQQIKHNLTMLQCDPAARCPATPRIVGEHAATVANSGHPRLFSGRRGSHTYLLEATPYR